MPLVLLSKRRTSHCLFFSLLCLSVNEGYLRYTQFRALQHFSSAALSVLSTQVFFFLSSLLLLTYLSCCNGWIIFISCLSSSAVTAICCRLAAYTGSSNRRQLGMFPPLFFLIRLHCSEPTCNWKSFFLAMLVW